MIHLGGGTYWDGVFLCPSGYKCQNFSSSKGFERVFLSFTEYNPLAVAMCVPASTVTRTSEGPEYSTRVSRAFTDLIAGILTFFTVLDSAIQKDLSNYLTSFVFSSSGSRSGRFAEYRLLYIWNFELCVITIDPLSCWATLCDLIARLSGLGYS